MIDLTSFHHRSIEDTLHGLDTDDQKGLTDEQVLERHQKFGRNRLPDASVRHPLLILLAQVHSIMVYILMAAALISYFNNHIVDVYVIVGLVLLNTIIGFYQEFRAEKSIQALKNLIVSHAEVIRNGEQVRISTHELCPGDIIVLTEGDQVPADARLLEVKNLQSSESSLTGESLPIDKQIAAVAQEASLADQLSMVFMGTAIVRGTGKAIVTAIGSSTALGDIAKNLQAVEASQDHFKHKTNKLAQQMSILAIVTTIITFLVGYFIRGLEFQEILMFAIASLVGGIPEGLPVVLTIVLAISAQRMAKRNAIVRRLSATETLAVVDTIITDKTGTLTQNQMTSRQVYLPFQPELMIMPEADDSSTFMQAGQAVSAQHFPFIQLLSGLDVCNGVRRQLLPDGSKDYIGDPTEVALVKLVEAAKKAGLYPNLEPEQLDDLPFSQEHRWRASLSQFENYGLTASVIGAPEAILENSTQILMPDHQIHVLEPEHRREIEAQLVNMSAKAMRLVALAIRPLELQDHLDHDDLHDLVFVGCIGIVDPPRPEVADAITAASRAGITTIMATGDHPVTALAIGREIGLLNQKNSDERVLIGKDLESMSDEEIALALKSTRILARMTPGAKLRVAQILMEQGKIVAMTGDGVNDAPALKQAHIGIAMGKNGTDVAREVADVVLADDHFASIINAVEEGRTQFRNIRRTSFFLITTNFAQSLGLIVFLLLNFPIPLLPKQILWLNMVGGGVTDISLATEHIHEDVLDKPPHKPNEDILNRTVLPFILSITITMISLSLVTFVLLLPLGEQMARTGVFVMMSLCQLVNVFNMRSLKKSIFTLGMFSNRNVNLALIFSILAMLLVLYIPPAAILFDFVPLKLDHLILIALSATLVLWIGELQKLDIRRKLAFASKATS